MSETDDQMEERIARSLARVIKVRAAAPDLLAELENLVQGVQEWCEAIEKDSGWDGWDHHFKHYNNKGLDSAKAAIAKAKGEL